jgi:peroxiredoxin
LDLNVAMLGPGKRSNRYSALVENGIVTQCFVEEGAGDLKVSDGDTMLSTM